MTFRTAQPNFSRGELAPDLWGRFDVDAYGSAVKKARNVLILKYGGLTKRPGTRLVAEVLDDSAPTRLIPFQFSLTQTYALEMGQGYMSPCANGGRVVEEQLQIDGITAAAQAVVEVQYHAYEVGDQIYLSGIAGDMGNALNGRSWRVTAVGDEHHFTIDANTTGLTFTGATGGIERVGAPTPPPAAPVVPPPVEPPAPPDYFYGGGGDFQFYVPYY